MGILTAGGLVLMDALGRPFSISGDVVQTGIPQSGLVGQLEADAGANLADGYVESWYFQETGSPTLVPLDTEARAQIIPSPAGANVASFTEATGMRVADTGNFPLGNSPRTVIVCWAPEVDGGRYGGPVTYGAGYSGQSFGILATPENKVAFDYFGARIEGRTIDGSMGIDVVTYDGTNAVFESGGVTTAPTPLTLNTQSGFTQSMLSFSGNTTEGQVAAALIWDRVLSDSEIAQVKSYLNAKYVNDVAPPLVSGVGISNVTTTSLRYSFVSNENAAGVVLAKTSSTPPSYQEAVAGTGFAYHEDGLQVVPSAYAGDITGLSPETTYYLFLALVDGAGNSAVYSLGQATTEAIDFSAPVITLGTPSASSTSVTAIVTTDKDNGTIYAYRSQSASETALEVVENAQGTVPVNATGGYTVSLGALTPETGYYLHVVHKTTSDVDSNVASAFFTTASQATFPTADQTVSNSSQLNTLLDNWRNNWAGTGPDRERYINLAPGSYSEIKKVNYNYPHKVHIRGSELGTAYNTVIDNIDLENSSNWVFEFIKIDRTGRGQGGRGGMIMFEGCQNMEVNYSVFYGDQNAGVHSSLIQQCFAQSCRYVTWKDNLFKYTVVGLYNNGTDDLLIEGNMFSRTRADDMKTAAAERGTIRGNFMSRIKETYISNDHLDGSQGQGSGGQYNMLYEYNCHMKGQANLVKAIQSFYTSDGPHHNVHMRHNVAMTNTDGCKFGTGINNYGGSGNRIEYCTVVYPSDDAQQNSSNPIWNAGVLVRYGSADYNLTTKNNGNTGGGANGINIGVGTSSSANTYAAYPTWFQGGTVGCTSSLGDLRPKLGTGTHYNDANPVGAFEFWYRVEVEGIHPGNSPNSILAAEWQAYYNADGAITS